MQHTHIDHLPRWAKAVNGENGSEDEDYCPKENESSDTEELPDDATHMDDCPTPARDESKGSKLQRRIVDLMDDEVRTTKRKRPFVSKPKKSTRPARKRKPPGQEQDKARKKTK